MQTCRGHRLHDTLPAAPSPTAHAMWRPCYVGTIPAPRHPVCAMGDAQASGRSSTVAAAVAHGMRRPGCRVTLHAVPTRCNSTHVHNIESNSNRQQHARRCRHHHAPVHGCGGHKLKHHWCTTQGPHCALSTGAWCVKAKLTQTILDAAASRQPSVAHSVLTQGLGWGLGTDSTAGSACRLAASPLTAQTGGHTGVLQPASPPASKRCTPAWPSHHNYSSVGSP